LEPVAFHVCEPLFEKLTFAFNVAPADMLLGVEWLPHVTA
jgi:hypothetical protein